MTSMSASSDPSIPSTTKPLGQIIGDAFRELGQTMVAFAKAPRALWGINIPYIIEGLSYFGGLTILGTDRSQ